MAAAVTDPTVLQHNIRERILGAWKFGPLFRAFSFTTHYSRYVTAPVVMASMLSCISLGFVAALTLTYLARFVRRDRCAFRALVVFLVRSLVPVLSTSLLTRLDLAECRGSRRHRLPVFALDGLGGCWVRKLRPVPRYNTVAAPVLLLHYVRLLCLSLSCVSNADLDFPFLTFGQWHSCLSRPARLWPPRLGHERSLEMRWCPRRLHCRRSIGGTRFVCSPLSPATIMS
jgi:hypothetical protein